METGIEKIDSRQTCNYRYIQKLRFVGTLACWFWCWTINVDFTLYATADGSRLRNKVFDLRIGYRDEHVFADKAGNKTVAKDLRQTLNKFTTKLSEFFDGAEQAINKQYEYVETAINNIGATSLQKEGMNRGSIGVGECNQQLHKSISFNIISLHTDGR